MKEITAATEIAIFEAFQKTEAYKTVTKGADVLPYFKLGFLAALKDQENPLGSYFKEEKTPLQERREKCKCSDCGLLGGYHHEDCEKVPAHL